MTFDPETGIYTDSTTGKVYDPVKMEWVNPKKAETKKVEKEGLIKTKRTEKKKGRFLFLLTDFIITRLYNTV